MWLSCDFFQKVCNSHILYFKWQTVRIAFENGINLTLCFYILTTGFVFLFKKHQKLMFWSLKSAVNYIGTATQ